MEPKTPVLTTSKSSDLFARAQKAIPGGVNSPVRAFKAVGGQPLFIASGKGSRITDADGNSFIDYVGSWGPLILGHANPQVLAAVREALEKGTSFGAPTESEVVLAEMVKALVPSIELVRFVNSGSEATMGALRVARGYTGRQKIIKFAGCFHGAVDSLLIKAGSGATTLGVPDSAGVTPGVAQDTLLAEFNDLAGVEALFAAHKGQVAALIVEPVPGNMGMILPEEGFLNGLRDVCTREGVVLIFDEVMSGFRVALGGAQALYSIRPDLTTFGKVIGGGFPVGGYGGRREIMEQVAPLGPVYQSGTLSGNPVAMAAGISMLKTLQADGFYPSLEKKSQRLMEGLTQAASDAAIPLTTLFRGGMMGVFFSAVPVKNYSQVQALGADPYNRFFRGMLEEGIYLAPSAFEAWFVSSAHSYEDLDQTVQAARKVLKRL